MPRPPKSANEYGDFRCSKCKRWKSPSEFYKATNTKAGLSSQCKECLNTYQAAYVKRRKREMSLAVYEQQFERQYPRAHPDSVSRMVRLHMDLDEAPDRIEADLLQDEIECFDLYLRTGEHKKTQRQYKEEARKRYEEMRAAMDAVEALKAREAAQENVSVIPLRSQVVVEVEEEDDDAPLLYRPTSWGPPA